MAMRFAVETHVQVNGMISWRLALSFLSLRRSIAKQNCSEKLSSWLHSVRSDKFPRKSTQIIWFVNRHLTLSTAYSQLFAGDYLHDMGKQGVGFVAVSYA